MATDTNEDGADYADGNKMLKGLVWTWPQNIIVPSLRYQPINHCLIIHVNVGSSEHPIHQGADRKAL